MAAGVWEYVTGLARLEFTPEEEPEARAQLEKIAACLAELSAAGAPSEVWVAGDMQLRPDEVRPSLSQAEVLANAPEAAEDCFAVPRTLGQEDGEDA